MRGLPTWSLRQSLVSDQLPRAACRVGTYNYNLVRRRFIRIQATPSADPTIAIGGQPAVGKAPDAVFEVLGAPYSLLSVALSPSQDLHTRRGTLVGLSGNADGTVSTLQIQNPLTRAPLGIPFLYQKITSTSPINALISTKSPLTSFAVLHLDGTEDWRVAQSNGLLAWTGDSLRITPTVNLRASMANWGASNVTGRGLMALVGKGQIFAVSLQAGEQYVAHPSNVVAYSISSALPRPYRFKSSTLKLQIPSLGLGRLLPDTEFTRNVKKSETWKFITSLAFRRRTWSRRMIWGDRLFLQFEGPATILVQSRASRVSDVLSTGEVNEIADAPPGITQAAVQKTIEPRIQPSGAGSSVSPSPPRNAPTLSFATIQRDGKVKIESTKDFSQLGG